MKTIFYNAHLVDRNTETDGALLIDGEKIIAVVQGDFSDADNARSLLGIFSEEKCTRGDCDGCASPCETQFVNCRGKTLMPSFIDMHVHFRYPGQTQKEDLTSGLNAAVAGGFGNVVCMPNTNPVVSSSELAHSIEAEAAQQAKARVIQSVSLTKDFDGKTTSHIDDLSGIILMTEDGHDVQDSLVMLDAMEKAAVKGAVVSCHCEDESFNAEARRLRRLALEQYSIADEKSSEEENLALLQAESYMEEANSLLALAEDNATERNIMLAEECGCKIHLAHVSTERSIQAVRREKANGKTQVTCEVTPHHFGLSVENSKNLRYIVNPPIRSEQDRLALIEAFRDGTVDVISTDHAPHTLDDKKSGSPGFPGLETAFAVANTILVKGGIIGIKKLSELMSANPAKILELDQAADGDLPCGILAANHKANLVLIDLDEEWTVDSSKFFTKGAMCPFEGMELTGKVLSTWFCGNKVF